MRAEFTEEEVSACLHGLLQEKGHDVEFRVSRSRFFSRLKGRSYHDKMNNFAITTRGDNSVILNRSWLLTLDLSKDLEEQVIEFLTLNKIYHVDE